MSEAGALRSFVVEALAGLGAAISEGGSLVWVRAPESLQRDLEVAANFALAFEPEQSGAFDAELVAPGSYFLERLVAVTTARGRWDTSRFEPSEADWVSVALSDSGFGSESGVRPRLLAIEDGVLLLFGFRVTLVSDEKRESFHLIAVSPVDGSAWAVLPDPEDPRLVPDAPIDFHPDLEAAYRFAIEAVRDETRAEVDRFRSRSLGLLEEEVRRVFAYFDNTLAGIREADPEGSQDLLRAVMAERDRRLAEAVERFDPKATASLCSVRAVFSPNARVRLEFQGGAIADINLDAWSRRLRGLVCGICHGTEGPWSFEAKGDPRCGRCAATGEESAPPRVRPPSDTPRRGTKAGRSAVRSPRGSRARSRAASAGDRGP